MEPKRVKKVSVLGQNIRPQTSGIDARIPSPVPEDERGRKPGEVRHLAETRGLLAALNLESLVSPGHFNDT